MATATTADTARLLFDISSYDAGTTENKLEQALIVATTHLGLDVGVISHIHDDDFEILYCYAPQTILKAGMVFPYKETICYQTFHKHHVVAIEKLSAGTVKPLTAGDYTAESYIASGLVVDGKVFGTLSFSSSKENQRAFSEGDKNFVMMFSRWVGTTIKLLHTERALAAQTKLLDGVINSSQQGITAFETVRTHEGQIEDFKFILVNAFAQGMFTDIEPNLMHKSLFNVFPYLHETGLLELYKNVVETGKPLSTELPIPDSNTGDVYWFYLSGVKLNDGLVVTYHNITEQKQREEQLSVLAFQDSLTGLSTRSTLARDVPQLLGSADRSKHSLVFIYLDLNDFKVINDDFGHAMGDRVLAVIGQRLGMIARHNEPLVRLGGDEFLMIASKMTKEETILLVERLISSIEKPVELDEHTFNLGASIGIYARQPNDATAFHLILNRADEAMFYAKKAKEFARSNYMFWSK